MAKRVRVQLLRSGVRAVLNSDAVVADVDGRVQAIARSAGPGFEGDTRQGANRASGMVKTTDYRSQRAQASGNALLKAIDAGR